MVAYHVLLGMVTQLMQRTPKRSRVGLEAESRFILTCIMIMSGGIATIIMDIV
ncbi:hypothetical protein BDR03DRAFT_368659 [Suillus americanus]|nr:hypothetical protein BDR03DRAFT_368659 [Suillus americanus]